MPLFPGRIKRTEPAERGATFPRVKISKKREAEIWRLVRARVIARSAVQEVYKREINREKEREREYYGTAAMP